MSMKEMLDLVREINEYSALLEEVKEILADRQDKVKAYMTAADLEELNVEGQFFVRYQAIARNTLNTSHLSPQEGSAGTLQELYEGSQFYSLYYYSGLIHQKKPGD